MSEPDVTHHEPSERDAVTPSGPLTAAERARRYRDRKRQRERQANGSWPPFAEGNTAALVHGASSGQLVDPLSAAIVAELLTGDDCPEHLRQPRYARALAAWGRAEAQCQLIATWIAGQDVQGALTEASEAVETSTHRKGRSSKRTTGRRVEGALSALDRAERRAASLRNDLGLTPASAARMRLDVRPRFDSALLVAALLDEDEKRAAAAAGSEGTDG